MSEPWDGLKGEILAILTEGVKEFASEAKPELQAFVAAKAEEAARWKWASLHADTPEKKAEAETNLKHIAAQTGGEAARLALSASGSVGDILKKVFDVALSAVVKIVPALL